MKVCIIDLITKKPTNAMWPRIMFANFAGIMPQVVAIWCEQEGHDVSLVTFTGFEDLDKEIPDDADIVFISAFTQAALLAYAISNRMRTKGAITVLGGPHARCYPQDSCKYFDYVLGFTNKSLVRGVLQDRTQYRPYGQYLSADKNPGDLPSVRERWKYIEKNLKKAPFLKMVPMLASMGCPYTCSFCIDATVPYQPLAYEVMQKDLRFLRTKFKRPYVGWYDPNFAIRFKETIGAIEEAIPPDSISFFGESSLSLLSEPNLKRMKGIGFKAILPGIESWYDMGNKSKTGKSQGETKVQKVVDHVNMILEHIPYIQTNFVLGLDTDAGAEPFELTKSFIDKAPGAFPGYSQLTAFGQAAPLNLEYQRDKRVVPFPFHLLDNNQAMNVIPKNYTWPELYGHMIDLTAYTFSWKNMIRRFRTNNNSIAKWMNLMRAMSTEGWGRLKYYKKIKHKLETEKHFRDYYEGKHTDLPPFFREMIKKDLGVFWKWLPEGALEHDPYAYLKSEQEKKGVV